MSAFIPLCHKRYPQKRRGAAWDVLSSGIAMCIYIYVYIYIRILFCFLIIATTLKYIFHGSNMFKPVESWRYVQHRSQLLFKGIDYFGHAQQLCLGSVRLWRGSLHVIKPYARTCKQTHSQNCIYIYIYMHIYIERERERERYIHKVYIYIFI